MGDRFSPVRVHVVVGAPWKDAVISYLEPRSPYRPWPIVADVRRGDGVVVVFDCEPRLVLTDVGRVDTGGDVGQAIVDMSLLRPENQAVPVSRIGGGLDGLAGRCATFEGAQAETLVRALEDHRFEDDPADRFGHSSMAAALVLLDSDGRCSGCDGRLNLRSEDAGDAAAVWTVDSPDHPRDSGSTVEEEDSGDSIRSVERRRALRMSVDWPAVLCGRCQDVIREGGFETFLDYRFSRHPKCPRCGARRTQRAVFGMLLSDTVLAPWYAARGCCVTESIWSCSQCGHDWGREPHR